MRSAGKQASAGDVLQAAERLWRAKEAVRKLQVTPRRDDSGNVRAPRAMPKRVTSVVSGGLPGQNRRK